MLTAHSFFELIAFIAFFFALVPRLGSYLAHVFAGKKTYLHPLLEGAESSIYRLVGINKYEEMNWYNYLKCLLAFNLLGFLALSFILANQNLFPLNPQNFSAVPWPLAFNIAASFVTNTNLQTYAGETTLSNFSQMVGLTSQNFLSPATGLAVLMALIRGLTRKEKETIGNFWVDLTRSLLYVLLPLAVLFALFLVYEGVPQTFSPYLSITTLENSPQTIPIGPVASQEAIKLLGTNGGGFFNANSAHPYENPTSLSNFFETIAILLIPISLVYAYGILINSKRQALFLLAVQGSLLMIGLWIALSSEQLYNPVIDTYPNMEGKEVRFGTYSSILWAVSTTATSNGSVNSMLTSLTPLAGGVSLFMLMLGEVVFGGVGTGLCNILMFILLTVFLSGLMVGRTPEYLGKKIEAREIQWVALAVLMHSALILIGSGITLALPNLEVFNQGPHGFSEVIYNFASAAANNGSSFTGLNIHTNYYNLLLGVIMLIGRLSILIPSLAIAGLLVKKNITPPSLGTFSTDSAVFALLLLSIIVAVAALTFFPAFSLGPIAEQLLMRQNVSF